MGVYIPNMEKPKNITRCSYKMNPKECKCIYTDKVFEKTLALLVVHPCPDCPLIEIVTCGECKWYDSFLGCRRTENFMPTNNFDFCSYGERRADGDI